MTGVDVAAIRAALMDATPGEWTHYDREFRGDQSHSVKVDDHVVAFIGYESCGGCEVVANAELIVLLRNNAEALLAEVERAQAASAGMDMLVAQAERRGAVKALRRVGDHEWTYSQRAIRQYANDVENGVEDL